MNWTFTYLVAVVLFMASTSLIGIVFLISESQRLTSPRASRAIFDGGLATFMMSIVCAWIFAVMMVGATAGKWKIPQIDMAIPSMVATLLLLLSVVLTASGQGPSKKMLLKWQAAVGAAAVLSFVCALWLSTQPLF